MYIDPYDSAANRLKYLIKKISGGYDYYHCVITPLYFNKGKIRILIYSDKDVLGFKQFDNVWKIEKEESEVMCKGGLESIALEFCLNGAGKTS
jgi:hypothetical protein